MADTDSAAGATPDAGATPGAEQHVETTAGATPDGELGDAGKRAIAEVRRELRAAQTERDELRAQAKEIEDRDKSELDKARERAETAESRLTTLERESWARTAAAAAGIPGDWERLHGANEDELKTDAESFAKRYGTEAERAELEQRNSNGGSVSSAELGAGARAGTATGHGAMNERIRQSARRGR
jgi:hypothetical protein